MTNSHVKSISTEIEELLERLKNYYPKFITDVEENILLKELYIGTQLIKKLIESNKVKVSRGKPKPISKNDSDKLEELKRRMDVVEGDIVELDADLNSINSKLPGYREKIEELKSVDIGFEEDLQLLVKENDRLLIHIETETSKITNKLNELRETDKVFNDEIDTYLEETNVELANMHETLDSVDSDSINSEIEGLRNEDIVIKNDIETNKELIDGKVKEVGELINDVDSEGHKNEIENLKAEDIAIKNKINNTSSDIDEGLQGVKDEDALIRTELGSIEDSLEGLEDNILVGSFEPESGKVPIADDTKRINKDWIDPDYLTKLKENA